MLFPLFLRGATLSSAAALIPSGPWSSGATNPEGHVPRTEGHGRLTALRPSSQTVPCSPALEQDCSGSLLCLHYPRLMGAGVGSILCPLTLLAGLDQSARSLSLSRAQGSALCPQVCLASSRKGAMGALATVGLPGGHLWLGLPLSLGHLWRTGPVLPLLARACPYTATSLCQQPHQQPHLPQPRHNAASQKDPPHSF